MASDLKKHLHINQIMKRRVGRGAFPAFGPDEGVEDDVEEALKEENRKGRNSKNKRKREESPQGPRKILSEEDPAGDGTNKRAQKKTKSQRTNPPACKACEKTSHELSECWDLFLENSPFPRSEWKIKRTMDRVNGDPKLKAEYDKVQAEKKKH